MSNNESAGKERNVPPNAGEKTDGVPVFSIKKIIIPFLIIAIAAAGSIYWYIGQLGFVSTDDAYIDGNRLSVSSKMLGRITGLHADEADSVKKGEILVELDNTDLLAQKKQAQATLDLALESISLSKVNLEKAQEDFDRGKGQYEHKIIPKEQFDHLSKALEAAKAENNIANTKIGTARAQLNLIETQLENTIIYAPMDGVIAKKWVMEGDVIAPGQPIFTIYDIKNIWVTAFMEETKMSSLHKGDKAEISVDAYPDQQFNGEIYQFGTSTASQFSLIPPSNASGNFTKVTQRIPVKFSIREVSKSGSVQNKNSVNLLPGMSVELKVAVN